MRVDVNHAANEAVLLAARQAALDAAGENLEAAAKQTVHVLTGNLRDEIAYIGVNPQVTEGYVLADTNYALHEHDGTRYRPGHPFFHEAIDREAVG